MWQVVVHHEVRPLIDALRGKKIGYRDVYSQLERDPCVSYLAGNEGVRPFAYRLSGPLKPKVCGVHLKRGYRLAFTMRPSDDPAFEGKIDILYVGERDTRDRARDTWTIVHDLFGEESPTGDHLRPPCCADDLPNISDDELHEFMDALRRFLR